MEGGNEKMTCGGVDTLDISVESHSSGAASLPFVHDALLTSLPDVILPSSAGWSCVVSSAPQLPGCMSLSML